MYFCSGKHGRAWQVLLTWAKAIGLSTQVLPCCSQEWGWLGEVWTARRNVYSRMCFSLGAAEHCRSFLVSGCDFLLPSYPLIFPLLLLWEGWPFSCVSGAPSFPSFLANALCHSLHSLIDLQGLFKPPFSSPLLPCRVSLCPRYSHLCSLHLQCRVLKGTFKPFLSVCAVSPWFSAVITEHSDLCLLKLCWWLMRSSGKMVPDVTGESVLWVVNCAFVLACLIL